MNSKCDNLPENFFLSVQTNEKGNKLNTVLRSQMHTVNA